MFVNAEGNWIPPKEVRRNRKRKRGWPRKSTTQEKKEVKKRGRPRKCSETPSLPLGRNSLQCALPAAVRPSDITAWDGKKNPTTENENTPPRVFIFRKWSRWCSSSPAGQRKQQRLCQQKRQWLMVTRTYAWTWYSNMSFIVIYDLYRFPFMFYWRNESGDIRRPFFFHETFTFRKNNFWRT